MAVDLLKLMFFRQHDEAADHGPGRVHPSAADDIADIVGQKLQAQGPLHNNIRVALDLGLPPIGLKRLSDISG